MTKTYQKDDLKIIWKPELCIHSKVCWSGATGLMEVFNPREKPWIKPENASKERIIEQIKKCPSGALSYEIKGQGAEDKKEFSNEITVAENGPLLVKGEVKVNYKGELISKENAAFCRCGHSDNKPFCDGSHKRVDFNG